MLLRLCHTCCLFVFLHLSLQAQCVAFESVSGNPVDLCDTLAGPYGPGLFFADSSLNDLTAAYYLRDEASFDPQQPEALAIYPSNAITPPPNFVYGQVYYLYATAGVAGSDGLPDPDNDGCFDYTPQPVALRWLQATPLVLSFDPPNPTLPCDPADPTPVVLLVEGGVPPYTYVWSTGETTATIEIGSSSITSYAVTVTASSGCSAVAAFVPAPSTEFAPVVVDSVAGVSCTQPVGQVFLSVDPLAPLMPIGVVNGPSELIYLTDSTYLLEVPGSGGYDLFWAYGVSTAYVCQTGVDSVFVPLLTDDCAFIEGTVYRDADADCAFGSGDSPLSERLVKLTTATAERYALSDAAGQYAFFVLPDETATLEIVSDHLLYENCGQPLTITTPGLGQTLTQPLGQQTTADCPLLTVQTSTSPVRRCFTVGIFVEACNHGTLDATDSYVLIDLDPLFQIDPDSVAFVTLEADGRYRLDIGDLAQGECTQVYLPVTLSCDAVLGQTVCIETEVFPDYDCLPLDDYNGAIVSVSGACDNGTNRFTVANTGAAAMQMPSSFIVIEDGVVLLQTPTPFDLPAGESLDVTYPGTGATYRLEAMQVPEFPGNSSMPSATIEGCFTNADSSFSTGFFLQFGLDDFYPSVDLECNEVIGSFDPNDKQAFPRGYGPSRYIENEQRIDYHIRFQNTGTDTAFTVVIEDALDEHLDVGTFRPLAASHPYEVQFGTDDTVRFVFNDILLPDSFVNEPLSHGFVRFSIGLEENLPLETVVSNQAGIYFDFNEPIITNLVFHTVGREFLVVSTYTAPDARINVRTYPNPVRDAWYLSIDNAGTHPAFALLLTDVNGRPVRRTSTRGGGVQLDVSDLPSGLYFYQVRTQNGLIASGKLIRQ